MVCDATQHEIQVSSTHLIGAASNDMCVAETSILCCVSFEKLGSTQAYPHLESNLRTHEE